MKARWVLGAKQGGFEQVWGHFLEDVCNRKLWV